MGRDLYASKTTQITIFSCYVSRIFSHKQREATFWGQPLFYEKYNVFAN